MFDIPEYLLELNQSAFYYLHSTYHGDYSKGKLKFPEKHDPKNPTRLKPRISEQELRMALIKQVESGMTFQNVFYSIETPTVGKFQFSGAGERSAMNDLTLYEFDENEFNKIAIIELKSNNPKVDSFTKDIEKMLVDNNNLDSNVVCAWCHLLENQDSGTVDSVLNKLKASFVHMNTKFLNTNHNNQNFLIAIHILKTGHLLTLKTSIHNILYHPASLDIPYNKYNNLKAGKYVNLYNNWQIDKL